MRRPLVEVLTGDDMRAWSKRPSFPTRPQLWQRGVKSQCAQPRYRWYEQHDTGRFIVPHEHHRESSVADAECFTCFNNRNPKESVQSLPPASPTGGDALPPPKPKRESEPREALQSLACKFTTLIVVPTGRLRPALFCQHSETLSDGCRSSPTGGGRGASHHRMRRR